jgi:isoquinoline 1-oxidoreductase
MGVDLKQAYRMRTDLAPESSAWMYAEDLRLAMTRRESFLLLGAGWLFTMEAQDRSKAARIFRGDDGMVTLLTGKVELGQGTRTLLAQCVAEEMGVGLERVRVVMGDTDIVPDDGGTWASATTPQTVPAVRRAAALFRDAAGELRASSSWTVLGRSVGDVRGRAIVTGKQRYASDVKEPGMVGRTPGRPAAYAGELPTKDSYFAGMIEGAAQPDPNPNVRYPALIVAGDCGPSLDGEGVLRSEYRLMPIAHVPLEPRACLARMADGKLTIRTGTQAPFLVREEVARAVGMKLEAVRVVAVDPGSGYGGKQRGELEIEAARLAVAQAGEWVRVQWTRRDEFERGYFRPGAVVRMEGVMRGGRVEGWAHGNYNGGASGLRPPYVFERMWNGSYRSRAPFLRQGSYRSLGAVGNNFARECFVDELARKVDVEVLEFRLRHVEDERLRHVARLAAEKFGWGKGKNEGVALNIEKGGRLACMVRVEAGKGGRIRVSEAVVVAEFGAALNPGGLRNQIEGGFIQSLGGALFEHVKWGRGGLETVSLGGYRVPRFSDVPGKLEVVLVDRRDLEPVGAGEAPVTMAAPAIGNAWAALTGERRRGLPLAP